ncbi:hypothetical protein [Corynebacterium sp. AOP12-C2-36]|uniref:hypothetical protein n=1 Tax=Corynebacterium sp. AOP12-C2-36 TaxID=3457723 RepID=UPI004033D960
MFSHGVSGGLIGGCEIPGEAKLDDTDLADELFQALSKICQVILACPPTRRIAGTGPERPAAGILRQIRYSF